MALAEYRTNKTYMTRAQKLTTMLTVDLIQEARERISGRIHRTPVVTSNLFNEAAGKQV